MSMAAASITRPAFLDGLLGPAPAAVVSGVSMLDGLRARALERANALSVPTVRDEDWRFTDLDVMSRMSFQPATIAGVIEADTLREWTIPECETRLVFVDGILAPAFSSTGSASGITVCSLQQALQQHAAIVDRHLGRIAEFDRHLFAALNTAFLRDCAVVSVEKARSASTPVHVLHVATRHERSHAVYPRSLIVAGAASRVTIVEDFVAMPQAGYFSAPVTEVVLDAHASVTHVRLQRESLQAFHLGKTDVKQASGSQYRCISIALGARLSRFDQTVVHCAEACETAIDGLALIGQRQLADTHSTVDHAAGQGRLRQLHKCIASGGAHGVFNGKILVRQGAQQTDAAQSCRGLLLSDRARLDVKPQLEIFADDVKCAHGAAIGQLDADELFYLRSRGLTEARARNLLTYAFAAEIIERVPIDSLVKRLEAGVLAQVEEAA
jgi:Fe-S cluster assembly protein SufD